MLVVCAMATASARLSHLGKVDRNLSATRRFGSSLWPAAMEGLLAQYDPWITPVAEADAQSHAIREEGLARKR